MVIRQSTRLFLFVLVVVSMILAGCAQPATPAATQAPAATEAPAVTEAPSVTEAPAATEAPAERKVATFIWTQEFDTLNPYYTNMWFSSVTQQLYNCWAWDFDEANKPQPRLVTELPSVDNGGLSADGKVITMKLRDDIVWSDGTPITSEDFVFTYQMIMADRNTVASRNPYDLMEKVEGLDARTVVITFKEPYAPWVANLWRGLLPAHVLKPIFDQEGTIDTAEWNKAPTVGCGPFVFDQWESGSFTRFVANEKYWLGRPKLDEIFFRFVPDDASQIAALKAGDGDLGTFFAYSDLPELEAAGIKIINSFSGYNEGIYFNMHAEKGHPALKDVKVRQAIALAFDRQKLVDDLLLGRTKVAATDWDNTPYNDPSISPWPYDPEKAKALLDEAGWVDSNGDGVRDKDGVELVLKYGTTTREIRQDTQAVAQQQLAEVGIKLDLQSFDPDIFFASYAENGASANFSLDLIEYSDSPNFPDPDTSAWLCAEIPSDENPTGVNTSGLCDEELDALFKLQATQVDYNERVQTFNKITKMIFENVYWLGLWQDPDLFGVSSRLANVKISGVTPFFNIMEWDLAQ